MTNTTQSSPGFVRISLAAAMTLGLKPGSFYRGARLGCLNLLLTYPEGCYANCSYCGLSRSRDGRGPQSPSFIRVEWPRYNLDEIINRTREDGNLFERVCVSMIMHPRAFEDALFLIRRFCGEVGLPVSVLVAPTIMEEGMMEDLKEAGADMASLAVDAATPDLFNEHRGAGVGGPHRWQNYWKSLSEAALIFGKDRAGCHLIAGLGEAERQMAETMQQVRDLGARTHLFSFYPEAGSLLAESAPCPSSQFRRIQLARFLIDYDLTAVDHMEFDEHGRITGYGLSQSALDDLVDSGKPFMTSGCPGHTSSCACNRPFGDGPPSDIRSYPFDLEADDIRSVRKELATYQEVAEEAIPQV